MDNKQGVTLAEFVQRTRNEKGFSLTDVQRQSGGQITDAYVSRIENGHILNVSPKKLQALAKGLQVPEDEIFNIARGKPPEPLTLDRFVAELRAMGVEDFHAAKGMNGLTARDMEEILAVVRSTAKTMVEQKLKGKR